MHNDIGISEARLRDTLLRATNATELFDNVLTTANAAWKENTSLTNMAQIRYGTTESKLTNLKNKATLLSQTIGDDLNPTIQSVIEFVNGILDKLSEMDSAQRMQIIKWAAIAAAVGPALLAFSKIAKAISGVTGMIGKFALAVGNAGGGFGGFMKVLGSSPAVWIAVAAAVVAGTIALVDYEEPEEALEDRNVRYYDRNGIEIPVETVPKELLTADSVAVLGSDGTLHVLITPEITGSEEAIEEMRELYEETDQLGLTRIGKIAAAYDGLLDTTLKGYINAARDRIQSAQNKLGKWWNFILGGDKGILNVLEQSMQYDFDTENMAELSTYVAEVVAAIKNGEEVSEEDLANLQNILGFIQELDTVGVGENVTQGIAEGMTAAGWDSSAKTVAEDLEEAINAALEINSPSKRMMPIGGLAAAGIAEGAKEYDFGETGGTVARALENAASGRMDMRAVSVNAMAGLAAGIRAGVTGVTKVMRSAAGAAVEAAKEALVIRSPSHVFRDEIGAMTMKGFGEGVLEESERQMKVIENASRMMTEEARESAIAYGGVDNRKTYNQQSKVEVTGNNFYIRDEKDVQALAIEIATLTRRRQSGRGIRMA